MHYMLKFVYDIPQSFCVISAPNIEKVNIAL